MNTTSKKLEFTTFIVFRDSELTNVYQKVLTHLYMPLVGPQSINIYTTLSTLIVTSENESHATGHLKLFQMLKLDDEQSFLKERQKLEAVGLLDVYTNNDNYIYRLNQPLNPNDFFNNDILSSFLLQVVKEDTYQSLMVEFLMHRFDLKDYQNVTCAFDDVFKNTNMEKVEYDSELKTLITTKSGSVIKVKNPHFDFQYLNILLEALDVVNKDIISSRDFYNIVNRQSFMYQLTTEEIKDAVVSSATPNGEINYDEFKKNCKLTYDNHPLKSKYIETTSVQNNDKLISFLEQTSPNKVVANLFGVGLVSSEIEMFDKLMEMNNINLGILNVLIIYVLKDKNGEIPSYNYFDKIVKTWLRMGISSTTQAMDYINGRTTPSKPQRRNNKKVPEWIDSYLQEAEKKNVSTPNPVDDENMKELNELFKFEEK